MTTGVTACSCPPASAERQAANLGRERSAHYSCCHSGNPLRCHGLRDDSHEALMCPWLLQDAEDNWPLFSFNIYLHHYLNVRHWQVFPKKPYWCEFLKRRTDLFSSLIWDSSHSNNKPQKSCTLNWFSGSSSARKPLDWQNLSIRNIYY